MIILRITINVIPEKYQEMHQTLMSMVESPEGGYGGLSFGVYCDIGNKYRFTLISEWQDRDTLTHFLKSDRFSVILGTRTLLRESLGLTILTVLDSEGLETVKNIRNTKIYGEQYNEDPYDISQIP
ncbi:hypothetical protein JCM14469_30600 [Desulfatiferula olefinivorans]